MTEVQIMSILKIIVQTLLNQSNNDSITIRLGLKIGTLKIQHKKVSFEQTKGDIFDKGTRISQMTRDT